LGTGRGAGRSAGLDGVLLVVRPLVPAPGGLRLLCPGVLLFARLRAGHRLQRPSAGGASRLEQPGARPNGVTGTRAAHLSAEHRLLLRAAAIVTPAPWPRGGGHTRRAAPTRSGLASAASRAARRSPRGAGRAARPPQGRRRPGRERYPVAATR